MHLPRRDLGGNVSTVTVRNSSFKALSLTLEDVLKKTRELKC
jgi:hypothetical protein